MVLLPRSVQASSRIRAPNRNRASVRIRGSNASSVESGAKHGAPHLARSKKGSPPSCVPPSSSVSALACASPPSRSMVLGPRRALASTRPCLGQEASPDIPASRVTGVDSDCTPGRRQDQQRESCPHGGSGDSYPSLTPVADKEQIFCRQAPDPPARRLPFRSWAGGAGPTGPPQSIRSGTWSCQSPRCGWTPMGDLDIRAPLTAMSAPTTTMPTPESIAPCIIGV